MTVTFYRDAGSLGPSAAAERENWRMRLATVVGDARARELYDEAVEMALTSTLFLGQALTLVEERELQRKSPCLPPRTAPATAPASLPPWKTPRPTPLTPAHDSGAAEVPKHPVDAALLEQTFDEKAVPRWVCPRGHWAGLTPVQGVPEDEFDLRCPECAEPVTAINTPPAAKPLLSDCPLEGCEDGLVTSRVGGAGGFFMPEHCPVCRGVGRARPQMAAKFESLRADGPGRHRWDSVVAVLDTCWKGLFG